MGGRRSRLGIGYPAARMTPARPRSVARLVSWSAGLVLAGCGDPAAPTPTPASTPEAAEAPSPAAEAEVPTKPEAKAPTDAKASEPAAAAPAGEDWLVWFSRDDQWVTRWIDATARESTTLAERSALVLSDGMRLWRIERHDGDVGVLPCECQEEADAPPAGGCKPRARLTVPGLRAVELGAGTTIAIRPPTTDDLHGDGIEHSVEPMGGAGPRLFYDWSESGYMCGAHGLYESGTVVFDLAAGKPVEQPFSAIHRALPVEVRQPAATEIHEHLRECDLGDAPTLEQVLDEQMELRGLRVVLTGGMPRIEWSFAAETYYVCSPDYAAWGQGQSALVPAGGPLGLDGLPPGVAHALSGIGDAPTVGWSRLSLTGPARTAALEAFRAVPEAKWPSGSTSERLLAEDPGAHRQARAKLDEGRRLTRSGDYTQAIARLDEAIALDPALARAWSERGYAKLLAGDLTGARADLEAALPLDESAAYRAAVHYNLGLLAERSGDLEAAKAAYEASLALRDNETVRKALAELR
jgi:hypothetical protein